MASSITLGRQSLPLGNSDLKRSCPLPKLADQHDLSLFTASRSLNAASYTSVSTASCSVQRIQSKLFEHVLQAIEFAQQTQPGYV